MYRVPYRIPKIINLYFLTIYLIKNLVLVFVHLFVSLIDEFSLTSVVTCISEIKIYVLLKNKNLE